MMQREINDVESEDEFFGEQSSLSDESTGYGKFGNLSQHENLSKEKTFFNLGYLEAFDRTKEEKLQEGFEAGYRQTLHDAIAIGHKLGKVVSSSTIQNDHHDTKVCVAQQVRTFLETEQRSDPHNLNVSKNDTVVNKDVKNFIQQLDQKINNEK